MNLLYVIQVLIGFGFVIFIHEMGHFLAAKRVGVTCPAFSIGFPMPLWTPKGWKALNIFKFRWKGTEYRLGWIPFGGYVTMHGQSDSPGQLEAPKPGDKSDYRNKSYWQKTQVLLGGVTMNAITAVIGFIVAFQLGVTFIEPTVGMVEQRSQAWIDNEIQVGDKILEVNGREVVDFEDVVYAGIFDGGDSIRLLIERIEDGKPVRKTVDVRLDENTVFGIKMPGIKAKHRVIITGEEAEHFPESLGENRPEDGDELVAIDGQPIRNAYDAGALIEQTRGEVQLTLRRGVGEGAREWTVPYTPRRSFIGGAGYVAGMALSPAPYVDAVQKGGPAHQAGLRQGDRIIAVGAEATEQEILSSGDLNRLVSESGGQPMTFTIERDGARQNVVVTPEPRDSASDRYQLAITLSAVDTRDLSAKELKEKLDQLGESVVIHDVKPGDAADKAGIKPGDVVAAVSISNKEFKNSKTGQVDREKFFEALAASAQSDPPAEIAMQLRRDKAVVDVVLKPDNEGPDSGAYLEIAAAEQRSAPVHYGLMESIDQGFYHSKKVGYKIIMTLGGLFTGRVKIWHLGGPVVIAKRSYTLAQWGAGTLIFFLAFISINLAIVNLLPLPVLDGGQWLIVTIESIRGKPLPERAMHWVSLASFIAVLGLMLFVLANDFVTVFVRKWV
jgi:regulator of sigma E protease